MSCLCVTEGRPEFLPWLLWNVRKQDLRDRELVVVDGSAEPSPALGAPDVRVVRCPPGTGVARKRNLAVEAARGRVVAWFDDDDWQHPRRLSLLVAALGAEEALAGPTRGWFVDLRRRRARPHDAQRTVIFNGSAARRSALDGVRFDEERRRAADTAWLAAVQRRSRRPAVPVAEVLAAWLCHDRNLSNPASRYVFPAGLEAVEASVGADAWGGTGEQLAALRDRLGLGG